ncbi:MAG: OmpA family protein [Bacteroidia bacterium]|jgi:outer membrane protein OmpA-like peptidoglycan-associated protein/Tfp pilus assembly protein PilF
MRLITLLALLLSLQFQLYGQNPFTGTTSKKAERLFIQALQSSTRNEYENSMQALKACLKEDPNFIDALMLMADLKEQNDLFDEAEVLYKKAISVNPEFQIPYYKLAVAELKGGRYADALTHVDQYLEKGGKTVEKRKVDRLKATATFGKKAMENPVTFNPVNLGPPINTQLNEYFPGITANNQTLIFTRLDIGRNEDFYISNRVQGNWSKAKNLGSPINTENNEGTVSLSSDGQYIFYTACNLPDGAGSCDLYFSNLDGESWKNPRDLGFPINTQAWESQPSLTYDGKTIYFSSSRAGGLGESDIWYTTYNKGRWSPPVNMGTEINTPGSEQSPLIAKDDQTLYFISDYHPGMGGMDLFVSRKQPDGRWGTPVNLGYPINTQNDEMCLSISANGIEAFIACEREEGLGGLDIYSFELPEAARPHKTGYIQGLVYNAKTLQKLKARLELIDLETGKSILEASSNKLSGEFLFCLQGNKNYALNVSSDGYLFHSENFSLKDQPASEPLKLDIPLNPIQVGEKIVLKNVFYDIDKFTIRQESRVELDKLIQFLIANPTVVIEVGGHTDNTGVKQKNLDLSNNRAKTVTEYIVAGGIAANRLVYKGYADTQPIADNKTDKGRQLNRRTEVKILRR